MSSNPPNEVKELTCDSKSVALAELEAAQAHGRPILLKNYCAAVYPQLQLKEWATTSHLKELTPKNPNVTVRIESFRFRSLQEENPSFANIRRLALLSILTWRFSAKAA